VENGPALSADRAPAGVTVSRRGRCATTFKQFYLPCLAHASYVIGNDETGTAAVVAPQRYTDQHLVAFAAERALKIKHVSQGFRIINEIAGGIVAWEAASLPVQSAPGCVLKTSEPLISTKSICRAGLGLGALR
jgi:hypothetical protein